MQELMKEFGVTQLEAVNILKGYYIQDYVHKYYRIKNKIPLNRVNWEVEEEDEEGGN